MPKFILLFIASFLLRTILFAQETNDKIMYVVDSIPVINDPEYGNDIKQTDIADITVVRNKDSLKLLGYEQFDGIIYLFTKEYRSRPDSIRRIPSVHQMEKKGDAWFFHRIPYNGRFIDYYYSGRKAGEGTLADGKLQGLRNKYYQNGNPLIERNYLNGIKNGLDKEYYEDGSLSQKGVFANGKEEGIWEDYYPNGQVKQRGFYVDGNVVDTVVKYYSNGKIKEKVFIKGDKVIPDPNLIKIKALMVKSDENDKDGNAEAAIRYCAKAIELDSTYAGAYFSRGTLELNDFQFDAALIDLDKAIQLEPYFAEAIANRAFVRIRKYQFADSRTLEKNNEVTVLASKDKVTIPDVEKDKICADLKEAIFLGDGSKMIYDAVADYCQ